MIPRRCKSQIFRDNYPSDDPEHFFSGSRICTVFRSFNSGNADIYPNVYILLTILDILPVSTATSERSFSTMRRLKTCLRSSIGNERMTGLALLSIHKDRQIDREKIMNDFVASSNRRSDFVL